MCGARSPATVDLILETLLRAKGNTIILGTTPYPDERSLKLAARRGVVVTASHFEILGFNAFAWSRAYGGESRQLWDWRKHPDLMAATWRAAIEAQKDYETIWSLGLRGLNDYAYPGCEGPADCGAVISEAVRPTPLKNGGDHSCCGRFGPLRNRPPVFWRHFLESWRQDGGNREKTAEK